MGPANTQVRDSAQCLLTMSAQKDEKSIGETATDQERCNAILAIFPFDFPNTLRHLRRTWGVVGRWVRTCSGCSISCDAAVKAWQNHIPAAYSSNDSRGPKAVASACRVWTRAQHSKLQAIHALTSPSYLSGSKRNPSPRNLSCCVLPVLSIAVVALNLVASPS